MINKIGMIHKMYLVYLVNLVNPVHVCDGLHATRGLGRRPDRVSPVQASVFRAHFVSSL